MDKLNEILNDEKLLRQIRSYIIVMIFIALPLLYVLVAKDVKIKDFLNFEVTGLGIIGILTSALVVSDFKSRAKENAIENEDFVKVAYKDLDIERNKISYKDFEKAISIIDEVNDEGQSIANKMLSKTLLNKYTNKIIKMKISAFKWTKTINRLENKKTKLESNNKYNRRFKPLNYSDVLDIKKMNNSNFNSFRSTYTDNANQENLLIKIGLAPLTFLGLGAPFAGALVFNIDPLVMLIYFGTVILLTAIKSLFKYSKVYTRVKTKTYKANLKMIELLKHINEEITKKATNEVKTNE
jgi:hypothetical protein